MLRWKWCSKCLARRSVLSWQICMTQISTKHIFFSPTDRFLQHCSLLLCLFSARENPRSLHEDKKSRITTKKESIAATLELLFLLVNLLLASSEDNNFANEEEWGESLVWSDGKRDVTFICHINSRKVQILDTVSSLLLIYYVLALL